MPTIRKGATENSIEFTMRSNGQPVVIKKDLEDLTPGERLFIMNSRKKRDD